MRGWRKRSPAAVSPQADERRDLRVESSGLQSFGIGAAAGQHADGVHSYPGLDASEGRSTRRAWRAQIRRGGPIADVRRTPIS